MRRGGRGEGVGGPFAGRMAPGAMGAIAASCWGVAPGRGRLANANLAASRIPGGLVRAVLLRLWCTSRPRHATLRRVSRLLHLAVAATMPNELSQGRHPARSAPAGLLLGLGLLLLSFLLLLLLLGPAPLAAVAPRAAGRTVQCCREQAPPVLAPGTHVVDPDGLCNRSRAPGRVGVAASRQGKASDAAPSSAAHIQQQRRTLAGAAQHEAAPHHHAAAAAG